MTTVAVVLAIHAFRSEAQAAAGGVSGSPRYILDVAGLASFMVTVPVLDENGNPMEFHPAVFTPDETEDGTPHWFVSESATIESNNAAGGVSGRYKIKIKSRPTGDYPEVAFPETIDQWGIYSTSFDFGFTGHVYISPVSIDANGTESIGQAVVNASFAHTGTWSVDIDGVVTKTPDPILPDELFSSGILPTGEPFKFEKTFAPESITIVCSIAHQADKDEADPFDGAAGSLLHINTFSCTKITY